MTTISERVAVTGQGQGVSAQPPEVVNVPIQTKQSLSSACPSEDHTSTSEVDLEARWIALARKGDPAGYDSLITAHRERALRLATGILNGKDEAEDAVQEAFLRAFAQMDQFRGEARFATWFHKIVVRSCLNRMRTPWWKRERRPRVNDFVEEDEGWRLQSPSPSSTPESDLKMQVETLLSSLTPSLRAAFLLREVEGLDYAEIADTLQIPVGTVRSRLSAAREQFRLLWEKAEEETRHV